MEYVWNTHGICMEYASNRIYLRGMCVECAWNMYAICTECVWIMFEIRRNMRGTGRDHAWGHGTAMAQPGIATT